MSVMTVRKFDLRHVRFGAVVEKLSSVSVEEETKNDTIKQKHERIFTKGIYLPKNVAKYLHI